MVAGLSSNLHCAKSSLQPLTGKKQFHCFRQNRFVAAGCCNGQHKGWLNTTIHIFSLSHSTPNSRTSLSLPKTPIFIILHFKHPPATILSTTPINPYTHPPKPKKQQCTTPTPSTPAATASRTKNGKAAPASLRARAAILTRKS